jgi:hypothetical protein
MNAVLAEGFMHRSWPGAIPAEVPGGSAAGIALNKEAMHVRRLSPDMLLRLTMSAASP